MSAIDTHSPGNAGYDKSDFNWTAILWTLPVSVILLVAYTLVCLFWFRGAKTTHITFKETQFSTEELRLHRTQEAEILGGYKLLDKEKGRVRIPIQRAMELVVAESQGKGTVDWKPITDSYMLGAAFAQKAPAAADPASDAAPAAPSAPAAEPKKAQEGPLRPAGPASIEP